MKSEQITRKSKSNFRYSFFFLPKEKREAIYELYAFCRQTDDIADNPGPIERRLAILNRWETELKRCFSQKVGNYFSTVRNVAERFKIPFEYFLELIAGVRMDLNQIQYHTFEELKLYCYRVASTVGLMSIEIFGYRDPEIRKYAEDLGIALQLTNIMRDVGSDARVGRIYLPQNELHRFGVSAAELAEAHYGENFRKLMSFQSERAHYYYRKANSHLVETERLNMLVAEIMKNIYLALLKKIEARKYAVLDQTIKLSTPSKFYIALATASKIRI